eukprot:349740-Chlamydomonas_euryale.AAC.7
MALDAMEHGRTVLWARLAGEAANAAAQDTDAVAAQDTDPRHGPKTRTQDTDAVAAQDMAASARLAAVGAAGRLATARFWSSIEEFAHNAAAVEAFGGLRGDHPFLCHRAGCVEVHQPAPALPLSGSPAQKLPPAAIQTGGASGLAFGGCGRGCRMAP